MSTEGILVLEHHLADPTYDNSYEPVHLGWARDGQWVWISGLIRDLENSQESMGGGGYFLWRWNTDTQAHESLWVTGPYSRPTATRWATSKPISTYASGGRNAERILKNTASYAVPLCWSSDGEQLIVRDDGQLLCWDVTTGEITCRLDAPSTVRAATAIGGSSLLTIDESGLSLWNLLRGIRTHHVPVALGHHAAFALCDGAPRVAIRGDGLEIYDVRTGAQHLVPGIAADEVNSLAWSQDGRWLAVGTRAYHYRSKEKNREGRVRVIDPRTGETHWETAVNDPRLLAFCPQTAKLAVAESVRFRKYSFYLQVWHLPSLT
jgi:WD40 repeat protein